MSKAKIYISDSKGYRPLDNDGKPLCQFKPFLVANMQEGRYVSKGQFITEDEELIKKLEAYPDFGKGFIEVPELPASISKSRIIAGVHTSGSVGDGMEELIKKAQEEKAAKFRRLGQLEVTLLNKNGEVKANMSSDLVSEYEKLKEELGV